MSAVLIGFAIYAVLSFLTAFGIAKAFFAHDTKPPIKVVMSRATYINFTQVKRFKFSKSLADLS